MPRINKIVCIFCKQYFYRDTAHINENKKLGRNFYCSKRCQYNYKKSGSWLNCENFICGKIFYRVRGHILNHNYCSRSCAAIINNKKYPKNSHRPYKICLNCQKQFKRDSKYCSIGCGRAGRFKYGKEEIIRLIQEHCKKLGRTPAKRESQDIYRSAEIQFGSWNKAVAAAGFSPNRSHENRMYKRIMTKAKDGHLCDSISEAIIDNWFSNHDIPHKRNVSYPSTNHKVDWMINGNTFIEYFGLAKDSPRYDRVIREKKELCRINNIPLVEIYSADLYPENLLKYKLKSFINK